jgi:predicted amidohydrolase YtcJ
MEDEARLNRTWRRAASRHDSPCARFGRACSPKSKTLCFQGIFVARYGERIDYVPARSVIEAGIPFVLGSDGPLNPYLNIMFAVIQRARPSEALTVEQAVEANTRGSAHAEFQEQEKGTITPGKLADLAVLSRDIFTMPVNALPVTKSVLTLVGGEIV